MTTFSCIIATHGDERWPELVYSRAYPSTLGQGFMEVVIHYDEFATLASVRNAAAETATGEMLVFLDADDELAPGYLAAMLRRVSSPLSPHPPLLVPAVSYIQHFTSSLPTIPQRGRWPELNECVIGTAVEKSMFEQVGGFRELPSLEDYDLWLRCYDAGALLVYVEDAVYRAHVSDGSRNLDQSPYQDIWQEHLNRIGG